MDLIPSKTPSKLDRAEGKFHSALTRARLNTGSKNIGSNEITIACALMLDMRLQEIEEHLNEVKTTTTALASDLSSIYMYLGKR